MFANAQFPQELWQAHRTRRAWAARVVKGRSVRVLLVRSCGALALFGFEIALARWLGVVGYGTFSFAIAVATVVSRLAPLGWLNASTRLVSTYISAERIGLLKGSLVLCHVATACGLALSALALLVLAHLSAELSTVGPILGSLLPLGLGVTLLELHRYVLRGLHAGDIGEGLCVFLLPVLVVSVIWIFGLREPDSAIWAYSSVCILLFLFSSVYIGWRLPASIWTTAAEFRGREWSKIAFAMLLGVVSDELVVRTAVIVLGSMSTEQELGLYQAAARLSLMNVFVLRALTPVAAPRVSVLYQEDRLPELRKKYRRLCVLSLFGALPFFICFMAIPRAVLGLFGPDFVGADWILRVLSIGYLVSATAGPCATALMMIGKEKIYSALAVTALFLNIVGNYVLVQYAGGLGAAIATATVVVGSNLIYVTIFFCATRVRRIDGER